jgi:hypothetical protein
LKHASDSLCENVSSPHVRHRALPATGANFPLTQAWHIVDDASEYLAGGQASHSILFRSREPPWQALRHLRCTATQALVDEHRLRCHPIRAELRKHTNPVLIVRNSTQVTRHRQSNTAAAISKQAPSSSARDGSFRRSDSGSSTWRARGGR